MPTLTIIRGLPGSGKSTYGRNLAQKRGCAFIEPDMFETSGFEYTYSPESHRDALDTVLDICHQAGYHAADLVVADVFPYARDVRQVATLYRHGFECGSKVSRDTARDSRARQAPEVSVIAFALPSVDVSFARNRHHVRREDIQRMHDEWEPFPGEHHLFTEENKER